MPDTEYHLTRSEAVELDSADALSVLRSRFVVDDPGLIYLDGNSLGRLPVETPTRLENLVRHEWGAQLIRGWNSGWMDLPFVAGDLIGGIIGARNGEVVVADSTSVNLFKLAAAAVQLGQPRRKIITDNLNFPSDLYVLQGLRKFYPALEFIVVPSDGVHGPADAIVDLIDDDTALVTLSHTAFKSGYVYDIEAINQVARRHGALTLWDLSHSVGSVPVNLAASGADLAVGCTYKYLNGGPGAPAFLFVREALQARLQNPISGWMSQQRPFDFALDYDPTGGIRRFLTGTPSVLAIAAVVAGVEVVAEVGIEAIRKKSVAQIAYLEALWRARLQPLGFSFNTPFVPQRRGSHVSLGHPEGYRIDLALINDMGVLPDFRSPDNLRLGIAPLYTRFEEIFSAVERIERVVNERIYERYPTDSGDSVT